MGKIIGLKIPHKRGKQRTTEYQCLLADQPSSVTKSTVEAKKLRYSNMAENKTHACRSKSLLNHYNTIDTHTHPFYGPFSGITQVSWYQKGKTNLDFTEARDSEWQWHQLGHMQVCTSLQTDNHASTPPLSFFTGRMPFLPPNQQCQSIEGTKPEKMEIHYD